MSLTNQSVSSIGMLKDLQILVVDNDRDSRDLYAFLLEGYGAKVTAIGSIKDALDWLHWYIPTILICEMRFLGESVFPLIQQVRHLAFNHHRLIPILVISTHPPDVQPLQVKAEAYLMKPIDLDRLEREVYTLIGLSKKTRPSPIQAWVTQQHLYKSALCGAERN